MYFIYLNTGKTYDRDDLMINICLDRYKDEEECADNLLKLISLVGHLTKDFSIDQLENDNIFFLNQFLRRLGAGDLTILSIGLLALETSFLEQDHKTIAQWTIEILRELKKSNVPVDLIVKSVTK
jgi:hypothetical protein